MGTPFSKSANESAEWPIYEYVDGNRQVKVLNLCHLLLLFKGCSGSRSSYWRG